MIETKDRAQAIVIAMDGPVAAGKGTLARRLAAELDFAYLDSGSLYRAVAAKILERGLNPDDGEAASASARSLTAEDLERDDLRLEKVSQAASKIAAIPAVREALFAFQRRFAANPPEGKKGAVIDGRDIGTVICPNAPIKFFVTASDEARAERRHKELLTRGEESIYARVLQDLRERDARDSARAVSPLLAAEDAIRLDTTDLNIEEAYAQVRKTVAERLSL